MGKEERKLNVVYFVDSEKTKSFRISLAKLNFLIIVVSLFFVWGVSSILFLYISQNSKSHLEAKLVTAKQVIFEYQSRYDKVYELAYPTDERSKLFSKGETEKKPKLEPQDKEVAKAESNEKSEMTETAEVENTPKVAEKLSESDQVTELESQEESNDEGKRELENFKITVQDAKITAKNHRLEINFEMRNLHKDRRERGYVWAVVRLKDNQGNTAYYPAPQYTKLDENGKLLNKKRSHKYSLKRFKETKFVINIPSEVSGKVDHLEVGLFSEDGILKEFNFPADIQVGSALNENPMSTVENPLPTPEDVSPTLEQKKNEN